ncbi:metal-sensitive transcriptional regulator [Candidatus Saccharibacteria bacterium]|nr:metal-sensitive transcriptional regulator [Candidatus Saccharibacteria bacterium]
MSHTYGYAAKKDVVERRLNRVEGQIRGINRMVQDDKYCIDILTQISAARSALDQVALELLGEHTRHCLSDPDIGPAGRDAKTEELIKAIGRIL